MSARHFDFLCAGFEAAESEYDGGRGDGDHALVHIDDLRAAKRVLIAAHALCDDTECTVFGDELGDHYRVPKVAWDELAAAMRGDTPPPESGAFDGAGNRTATTPGDSGTR